ncbi:MAG: kinase, partial [Gracilibacter sp. BRH_c7a]
MKRNNTKRTIYLRVFGAFFATYLVLMAGFSIFLVLQEKEAADMALRTFGFQVNNTVEDVLQDDIDNDNQITDIAKVKKEFVSKASFLTISGTEAAIFTGDYNLVFNTNDYWLCGYTERTEGSKNYTGYGLLNPEDWFNEKEIFELENYLYANPKAEKTGDLTGYSLSLEGFWLDNEMIIPDKITVNAMYAHSFDENGNVSSGGGTHTNDIVYVSGYQNTKNLPYFKYGYIQPNNNGIRNSAQQSGLRQVVLDQEKLKQAVKESVFASSERVSLLTYRYCLVLPYRNTVHMTDDQNYVSEFWTVIARDVNLWDQAGPTLIFVWGSCLVVLMIAAFILASQTYNTYQKREELERQRQETTKALAHDLKTPLSIISGYAQNLMENIHTEKREYYAGNIQTNVTRMDKIIREMLELTRLESDSLPIQWEDVSLGEVGTEIMNRYKLVCDEKSIMTCLEGDAVVKADHSLMARVIDNFFINALDHTPVGGTIRIRIFDNTLEIYNSGSHIPEEKIKEIWQPYQKADVSRSNTKGTGLGLAISR